ncbi:MAG: hypothetical protein ACI9SQ_000122 [Rubritalea sp.]|jgi:hypothetical protein
MSSRADPSHGAPENMIISVDLGAHYALEDLAYWDGTAVPEPSLLSWQALRYFFCFMRRNRVG